jgi:hypothetical protein
VQRYLLRACSNFDPANRSASNRSDFALGSSFDIAMKEAAMSLDLATFTEVHRIISLLAIAFGALMLLELLGLRMPAFVAPVFLLLAFLTSATGFFFPFNGVMPSHIVGGIALMLLGVAVLARYIRHYMGGWRWIYAAAMVAGVYLLIFVGIAQAFAKLSFLQGLAPTQSEPPFTIAQGVLLLIFIVLGIAAARRYRPAELAG